jgi:hypothetical protein
MRTFANTLLFNGLLERLPSTVDGNIYSAAQLIQNLPVSIIESDCQTMLGTNMPLSPGLMGYIETATGQPLTSQRINYLLSQGSTSVYTRQTSSCISKGGLCQVCYAGTFGSQIVPPVSSTVSISPTYLVGNQYFYGDGSSTSFNLTYNLENTQALTIYINNTLVSFNYSLTGNVLTLQTPPPFGSIVAVRSQVTNTSAFQDILAKSYSGGLIGITPRPIGFDPPVKRQLYETQLQGSSQGTTAVIQNISTIPSFLRNYAQTITSPLESTLFNIHAYAVFT